MENEQKIKDSKGNIYDSCPYIDEIISTLDEQLSFYNSIKSNLEIIRKINRELRHLKDGRILALEEISDRYEIVNNLEADVSEVKILKRDNADGTTSWIPLDEANADYQAYLNPEAALSTPIATE